MNLSMSKDKSHKPQLSFKDLQSQIDNFREKRDELNNKTKGYINSLQGIDSEIIKSLKAAKDVYKRKRDYWNKKVKELKNKKIEYKGILDNLIKEKKKILKSRSDNKGPKRFISIKMIDRKIDNLERIIETENLDINEENKIIDKIRDLAEERQKQLTAQQIDGYYKLERKMEIVKINLNKIYEQLNKWSNKSQDNHEKMLELYQKVNELKDKKKLMEEELIENKKAADKYHEQFLEAMRQKKKRFKGRKPYQHRTKTRPGQKTRPRYRQSRKDNELLVKIKKEKLATALEKQKAGKKLNLFEARLILEQSGK